MTSLKSVWVGGESAQVGKRDGEDEDENSNGRLIVVDDFLFYKYCDHSFQVGGSSGYEIISGIFNLSLFVTAERQKYYRKSG